MSEASVTQFTKVGRRGCSPRRLGHRASGSQCEERALPTAFATGVIGIAIAKVVRTSTDDKT